MSDALNDGELRPVKPWNCICGFSTISVMKALKHIEENHPDKTLKELTVRKLSTDQRLNELKELGINQELIKSDWCLDCFNVNKLPNCPCECDGMVVEKIKGYIQNYHIEIEI